MVIAAGIVAVVSQIFQANDHTSVWLAFALAWIACALVAIASSSLVFRVAEARKHIAHHQQIRRVPAASPDGLRRFGAAFSIAPSSLNWSSPPTLVVLSAKKDRSNRKRVRPQESLKTLIGQNFS